MNTMTASITNDGNYIEMVLPPTADTDMRGRKRHRSPTRHEIRAVRTGESSTLRGRSRHRAISPHASQTRSQPRPCARSRAHSPALGTFNDLRLAFGARERKARRDHCPSRPSSVYPAENEDRKSSALIELEQMTNASAS